MEDSGRRRVQVTDRDRLVLEFAAEHRLVLAGHVQALLAVSAEAAARRLRALVTAGLLSTDTVFHRYPACFQVTHAGLAIVGSRLPKPKLDYRSYAHDVGVAWLWLTARRGAFGPLAVVVSEREMRSRDGVERHEARRRGGGRARMPFGVTLSGLGSGEDLRLHYPDLLLCDPDGRRIAVELELTPKNRTRREKIIGGYAADARIDAVLYLVEDPRIARAVQATARQFGFERRLHVQPVRFGSRQAPGYGQGRERSASRERRLVPPAFRSRRRQAETPELAR
jgi:hypothetical protein